MSSVIDLVNFVIHIASGIFLYWFLMLTFNLPFLKEKYGAISYKVALFSSLIFISHPSRRIGYLHRAEDGQYAGMFYLLSLVLYVKGRHPPGGPGSFTLEEWCRVIIGSFFKRMSPSSRCSFSL